MSTWKIVLGKADIWQLNFTARGISRPANIELCANAAVFGLFQDGGARTELQSGSEGQLAHTHE
jgi:hypothetical protein